MRYLVTGASGLLGLNLSLWLSKEHEITGVIHRPELKNAPYPVIVTDLSLPGECARVVEQVKPDVIIHTAAMAIVDECESQPERAMKVNAELPGTLAGISRKLGIQMLHISTDAVFDGQRGGYSEEDKPNPLGVYAQTKLAGEQAILNENADALIARVNFYGFSLRGQRSLAENFIKKFETGQGMNGFTDVFFCSLYVMDLSQKLIRMLELKLKGLYHTVSHECISKYEFGVRIARTFKFNPDLINPISVNDSGLVARRSPKLCLNVSKLEKVLGEPMPTQDEGLQKFFGAYKNGTREHLLSFLAESVRRT
jgi:dTDP-4-dehydrorhamnose reductase